MPVPELPPPPLAVAGSHPETGTVSSFAASSSILPLLALLPPLWGIPNVIRVWRVASLKLSFMACLMVTAAFSPSVHALVASKVRSN